MKPKTLQRFGLIAKILVIVIISALFLMLWAPSPIPTADPQSAVQDQLWRAQDELGVICVANTVIFKSGSTYAASDFRSVTTRDIEFVCDSEHADSCVGGSTLTISGDFRTEVRVLCCQNVSKCFVGVGHYLQYDDMVCG